MNLEQSLLNDEAENDNCNNGNYNNNNDNDKNNDDGKLIVNSKVKVVLAALLMIKVKEMRIMR